MDYAYLYLHYDTEGNFLQLSGMTFQDYVRFSTLPLEHLLLLKADALGNRTAACFEVLDGRQAIANFIQEGDYRFDDFCFIDYNTEDVPDKLTDPEIAELLFLGHMKRPLRQFLFPTLHNHIAYLAHDDGWSCKLYAADPREPAAVVCRKLLHEANLTIPDSDFGRLTDWLLAIWEEGILFDRNDVLKTGLSKKFLAYAIGKVENMDLVSHTWEACKLASVQHVWHIE